ncbi:L-threonylcarbamoyladenylate synthase [Candidatus Margulisiibacteriota bacterium]
MQESIESQLKESVRILKTGGVIIFPTDTVYGIGCAYDNKAGIERIYEIKKRPKYKPLQILISDIKQLDALAAEIPAAAQELMEKYWPGALTLILKTKGQRLNTIGIRMPNHPIPLQIIKELGKPLAATSANLSGEPDPSSPAEITIKADYLIDAGKIENPQASSVIDVTCNPPKILRKGRIKI